MGLLAYALYDAISLDLMLCPGDRWKVYRLYRAGYRAGNVVYFMEETWPKDWRAAKNEPLTFEILLEHIADSRSLHPGGAGDAHELMRRLNIVRERLANGLSVTEDDLLPDPKICANLQ